MEILAYVRTVLVSIGLPPKKGNLGKTLVVWEEQYLEIRKSIYRNRKKVWELKSNEKNPRK